MSDATPTYPIYVPSKGRADLNHTADMFTRDKVPFRLVVEEPEHDLYQAAYPDADILVLPFVDQGSVIPARNWIRDHAEATGATRHWQFDDNIRAMFRVYRGKKMYCRAGIALAVCEDFTDRYLNVGISGFNYSMFLTEVASSPPFVLNAHIYSCTLVNHAMPYRWRGRYNEDTDLCLQALAGGWCTIQLQAFLADKKATMLMGGGNTDSLYQGDGRLRMARSLERLWPGVVKVDRRYGRPQHVINWRKFDTALIRDPDVEIPTEADEYGMQLTVRQEVKSPRIRAIVDQHKEMTQ